MPARAVRGKCPNLGFQYAPLRPSQGRKRSGRQTLMRCLPKILSYFTT
ncbi:hypothetical protein OHAE_544 [Ochrobactrum soli]|uniref:Uncharacterized protein n=1 Tax=Ochrobactrum soli TaxID=2448455 RepID=A0A2P9HKN8_9HYPH|nr:hypothetical protein OHAE_544 [[Ochrobactrum] soli]